MIEKHSTYQQAEALPDCWRRRRPRRRWTRGSGCGRGETGSGPGRRLILCNLHIHIGGRKYRAEGSKDSVERSFTKGPGTLKVIYIDPGLDLSREYADPVATPRISFPDRVRLPCRVAPQRARSSWAWRRRGTGRCSPRAVSWSCCCRHRRHPRWPETRKHPDQSQQMYSLSCRNLFYFTCCGTEVGADHNTTDQRLWSRSLG